MKNIVIASGLQIYPPLSGGQLRSANLCKALADLGYSIDIYSLTGRKENYLKLTSDFVIRPEAGIREHVDMNPIFGAIQFLFYKLQLPPLWLSWVLKYSLPRKFRQILAKADILIIDFPFTYTAARNFKKEIWYNAHNAEFELWQNPRVAGLVQKVELRAIEQATATLFCSEVDRDKFSKLSPNLGRTSYLVPNGVDLDKFKISPTLREKMRKELEIPEGHNVFLFTGSTYAPNREAFQFLLKFATERAADLDNSKVIVMVVGTVCEEKIDQKNFKVLGKVETMTPFFAASDFGLNPVLQGSGVNVKMIEFMAAGLPILSTPFGARGLKLRDRESYLCLDRGQLFAGLEQAVKLTSGQRQDLAKSASLANEAALSMTNAVAQFLNLKKGNQKNE